MGKQQARKNFKHSQKDLSLNPVLAGLFGISLFRGHVD